MSDIYQPFPLSKLVELDSAQGLTLIHVPVGPEEASLCPGQFLLDKFGVSIQLHSGYRGQVN